MCNGQFGKDSVFPQFNKDRADSYFNPRYSTATPINVQDTNWFPNINTKDNLTAFNVNAIKPKDVKKIVQSKSNTSAAGPDGISYAIMKKLPCLHHILATLYSKLLSNPEPPLSWSNSKVTLIYKKGDTNDPANFRMIALSSTFGKTFHQILSQRFSHYLTVNGYIDATTQKAFLRGINGVIEHNQVFQELIRHAKANKRTIHATFFDLEDAFGSVQHNLISHSLNQFDIPENISNYVLNLYSNLQGSVVSQQWSSEQFKFAKGVFQGDPLSPIVFLICFNPIIEKLKQESKFGYDLNGTKYITTPFADDFNLITTNKRTHQRLINNINGWINSMGLKLKPPKCVSISIISGKPTPVNFEINNSPINTLQSAPHKFLGSHLTFQNKQSEILNFVSNHIRCRLDRVDELLIRNEYKIRIYRDYILPATRFHLTVHELTSTSLDKLDALANRYVKRWTHLPRSATPAVLHLPCFLDIKSIKCLYHECQTAAYVSSRLKADHKVQNALDSKLKREAHWTRKSSVTVKSQAVFESLPTENNPNSKYLIKTAKDNVKKDFIEHWKSHVKSLLMQGNFLRLAETLEADVDWKSKLFNLPRNMTQFLLNSVLDTLPTNSNLVRWNQRSNERCTLCGSKETLLHVLNNCEPMLERYTWRHDSVLNLLFNILCDFKSPDTDIYADLSNGNKEGISTIPISVAITNQRPDLVLVNKVKKQISILELTIPFESGIEKAHERKTEKYSQLISDIKDSGYDISFHALEIGSRGMISKENSERIFNLLSSQNGKPVLQRTFRQFKARICKTVLIGSYVIFYSKYDPAWRKPTLIACS